MFSKIQYPKVHHMKLFSEIYNCYYQVLKSILHTQKYATENDLYTHIQNSGYEESALFMVPKLISGEWNLLKREGNVFLSKINDDFFVPLTALQTSFLKSILSDEKMQLFFDTEQINSLHEVFANVTPLWSPENFYYYDRFSDKDDFSDSTYIQNFRTLVTAIKNKEHVDVLYHSRTGNRIRHWYVPCRLEYSMKNDKFRLFALENRHNKRPRIETVNLDRIENVTLLDKYEKKRPNINKFIKHSYYKEPVHLIIKKERNALERTMLQFANYEKNTKKIDENTYECFIYYNKSVETELLIEILSFGPMVQVVGNEYFLNLIKERLKKQKQLQQNEI